MLLLPVLLSQRGFGWGADGHRLINRIAAETLPSDVPAFLRDARAEETISYLGPEPDRWRDHAEPELAAAQAPEHFIDLEYADLVPELPHRRYDYIRALAVAQKDHPDLPLSVEKVGLQPYVTLEIWERLKAAMREYRTIAAAKGDTRPVELAITFYAGWLGHYVADGSQPLHTTVQYNGWTGANPNAYTTEHSIHAQFETVYVSANIKAVAIEPLVRAMKPKILGDPWTEYMAYLRHSHSLVERTYELEKERGFVNAGTAEARQFTEERLAAGATELRDLIYTAWIRSADPVEVYKGPS